MKIRKPQHAALTILLVTTGVAATDPASAQQPVGAADQGLQEVIVTARKRDERLQDVPMSITAFTADAIEQRGIESIYDIARITPNLSFNQTYGRVFDRPVIRGMSQILGERTVSFVVDGVYIAGNITGADLDDVHRGVGRFHGDHRVRPGRYRRAGHDPVRGSRLQCQRIGAPGRNVLGHGQCHRVVGARPGDVDGPNRIAVHRRVVEDR